VTRAISLVLVALGVGLLMPPATSALVSSLPPAKAGVGSALNDATREVGGALGIAVIGALVSVGYRASVGDALDAADAEIAEAGRDSIGTLLSVTADLDDAIREPLVDAAATAFTDGATLGMGVAAALLAVTAVLVAAVYPRSPSTTEAQPQPSRLEENITS
jgi:hypothetical protein